MKIKGERIVLKKLLRLCAVALICCVLIACTATSTEKKQQYDVDVTTETTTQAINPTWENRLYTPTFVEKIEDLYFIVDCWHHRVIYNNDITSPIDEWYTLDNMLGGPHSIASDGELYVVEDTGNQAVKVYKKNNNEFIMTQHIQNITVRPHRVLYSQTTNLFYILGSEGGNLYIFENKNGELELIETKAFEHLMDTYVRSIRIIEDSMYFVSGKGKIVVTSYIDGNFDIISEYGVPDELSSMNDIQKMGDYFYISATPQKLVRVKDLNSLATGEYEDIFDSMGYKGTPYYFSIIDGKVYLPEITEYSSIVSWRIDQFGNYYDITRIHDFGLPSTESENRKSEIPI